MSLPKDPFMLLSYVNTQLRDNFSSLSELCSSLGVSEEDIVSALANAGFSYDEGLNRFTAAN
jgi:biotin operon repressor